MWNICRSPSRFSLCSSLIYYLYKWYADKLVSLSRLFADDTSFGYSNQDTMQLKNVIDHELNEMDLWSNSGLCYLILTKQKSWFSLVVAFQKILISLSMENQCPLLLLIDTYVLHLVTMLSGTPMLIIFRVVYIFEYST